MGAEITIRAFDPAWAISASRAELKECRDGSGEVRLLGGTSGNYRAPGISSTFSHHVRGMQTGECSGGDAFFNISEHFS